MSFIVCLSANATTDYTIWTGSVSMDNWTGTAYINKKYFANAVAGDVVHFSSSGATSEAQIQIKYGDTKIVDYNANTSGSYAITLTAAQISGLQTSGMQVKGKYYTLTSVVLSSSGASPGDPFSSTTTNVWTGSFDAGSSSDFTSTQTIAGTLFSNIEIGDVITLACTTQSSAQIQVADAGFDYYFTESEYDCADLSGNYTIEVTQKNINRIKTGLAVKGKNFTLTAVSVTTNGTGETAGWTVNGFHTSGKQLLDGNGNEFLMRGVNYSYAWQQGQQGSVLPAAKRQYCNTVRIQLSNGKNSSLGGYTSFSAVQDLIARCEDNKLVCVLNVQDPLGSDNVTDLEYARDYWISIKNALIGHENTVILNIANEWVEGWSDYADTWASGYKEVIPQLRAAGIKNTLMVDCAGYGQYADVIWNKGGEVLATDTRTNTMFSIHMYEHACYGDDVYNASATSKVTASISSALGIGAPLVIGEFGYQRYDGRTKYIDWKGILKQCELQKAGYLGWSWTGNGGNDACLDMFGDYSDGTMKTNGDCIINGYTEDGTTYGIKATSKECTVYNTLTTDGGSTPETLTDTQVKMGAYYGSGDADNTVNIDGSNVSETMCAGYDAKVCRDASTRIIVKKEWLTDANIQTGDTIRVNCTGTDESSFASVKYRTNGELADMVSGSGNFSICGWKHYDFVYTSDVANLISAANYQLVFGGTGYTVASVYVIRHADGQAKLTTWPATTNTETVFGTSTTMTAWGANTINIAGSAFANAKAGSTIRIAYTDASSAQLQVVDGVNNVRTAASPEYSWISDGGNDYTNLSGSGNYDITVSDAVTKFTSYNVTDGTVSGMVANLKADGIRIDGHGFTLSSVQLISTSAPTAADVISGRAEFTHKLNKSMWKPICLPYNMTQAQIATVFGNCHVCHLSSAVISTTDPLGVIIHFGEVTDGITANHPYIINLTDADRSAFIFNGVSADVTSLASYTESADISGSTNNSKVNFISVMPSQSSILAGDYYFYQGGIYKSANGTKINSGLAFLRLTAGGGANGYYLSSFDADDETPTAINGITDDEATDEHNGIFNLNGQRISSHAAGSMQRGIYIVNGKKMVIK